jgi:hypothetical protein
MCLNFAIEQKAETANAKRPQATEKAGRLVSSRTVLTSAARQAKANGREAMSLSPAAMTVSASAPAPARHEDLVRQADEAAGTAKRRFQRPAAGE